MIILDVKYIKSKRLFDRFDDIRIVDIFDDFAEKIKDG
jgi:hypothetical protein